MNNRPADTTDDSENIELFSLEAKPAPLIVMSDDAVDERDHCYTLEYACAPFKAACNEVRTSSMHLRVDDPDNAPSRCETAVALGCAAPLMFVGASIVSVFGFFAGAARDSYHAIQNNCCVADEEPEQAQDDRLTM